MRVRRSLISILFLCFCIRFLLLIKSPTHDATAPHELYEEIELLRDPLKTISDSQEYKALAKNLLKGKYTWKEKPVSFRPPGYPLFLSFCLLVTRNEFFPLFIQIILSVISAFLIFILGKEVNEKAGLFASLLFSIDMVSIYYSTNFMSETLFLFLLLLSAIYFKRNNLYLSGLLLGFCALTRAIALYSFIVFLPFIKNWKKVLKFLSFFFIPILPWLIRNYLTFGVPCFTSVQGYNLLYHNAVITENSSRSRSEIVLKFKEELLKEDTTSNPLKLSLTAQKIALKKILRKPFRYISLGLFQGLLNVFRTHGEEVALRLCGYETYSLPLLEIKKLNLKRTTRIFAYSFVCIETLINLFALICFILGIIKLGRRVNFLYLGIVLYFFLLSLPVTSGRFKLPFMPFIYLIAGSYLFGRIINLF